MARVALVCEPPDGGVAEHVLQLALGLRAHGHEAVVLGPAGFAGAAALDAARIARRVLPLARDYAHPHREAAALARLIAELRRERPAVVHAHAAKAGLLGRLAAAACRIPAIYTPHCLPFVGEVSAARRRLSHAAERALGPLTAALICVCEDERRVAREASLVPSERLAVVHNGCAPPPEGLEPDPALAGDGPLVGAVTVLRRQKSVEVLLEAVPRIRAAVPEARFAVVGDGPEGPALRARAPAGVDFLPFRAPAARHLLALDVYVLPSAWEAFPIGVLEAQACGVPQVATDVGGTREAVVEETGILVPPRDPAALADAIVALLEDPERRDRMANASRERHAALFTTEKMIAGTAAVYDRVLARRR